MPANPDPIRLLIADDHAIVRRGLAALLENSSTIRVVAEAGNGQQALELAALHQPDVVLMDIAMPVMDGLLATVHFAQKLPQVRLLILSMHNEAEYVEKILQTGAHGYITKDTASEEELERAIVSVHQGGIYLGNKVSHHMVSLTNRGQERPADRLTQRECEVLTLIATGNSNKVIARQLAIDVRTVETHRLNLRRKLDAGSTADLVRHALQLGLV